MMRSLLLPALLAAGSLAGGLSLPQQPEPLPVDTALARRFFQEADALTARDSGLLWGRSLAGPLLFVHLPSRKLLSSVPGAEGALAPHGSLFTGRLPESEAAANTSLRWAGRTWAMILWPPTADSVNRQILFAHELWHRVQDSLGFPSRLSSNAHLGARDARVWLRLEGRALAAALRATGSKRAAAVRDAIAFRRVRRAQFPDGAADERALELNEGLAEYTGIALAAASAEQRHELARRRLAVLDTATNFERDFAYHTGPAWGLLLDRLVPGWRRSLRAGDDLAEVASGALRPVTPTPLSAATQGRSYGIAAVRKNEAARAAARERRLAGLRVRFVTGPLLELPLAQMRLSFDPAKVEAFEGHGSVYGMLRLSDRWGVLQCDASGGLIAADFTRALVPAPSDTAGRRLTGPGWVLELQPGWRLTRGTRPGSWTVTDSP